MGYGSGDDDGFDDFLQAIIRGGHLEGAALGITRKVIAEGSAGLSSRQAHFFQDTSARRICYVRVQETGMRHSVV